MEAVWRSRLHRHQHGDRIKSTQLPSVGCAHPGLEAQTIDVIGEYVTITWQSDSAVARRGTVQKETSLKKRIPSARRHGNDFGSTLYSGTRLRSGETDSLTTRVRARME